VTWGAQRIALREYSVYKMKTLTVGIYIFNDVEVLDFAGPFEVFSVASRAWSRLHPNSEPPFNVFTIGETQQPVKARGGLMVTPQLACNDHPKIDVLLIPGGVVTAELKKPTVVAWISKQGQQAQLVASVCTGAFLIGKAGILAGKSATTHWEDIADLRSFLPDTNVVEDRRWVDEGRVVTSAGISAGLDMSLYLVARLIDKELAIQTARRMDYEWREKP
jgi:transcriptional regulator GlxA family with amidase domain